MYLPRDRYLSFLRSFLSDLLLPLKLLKPVISCHAMPFHSTARKESYMHRSRLSSERGLCDQLGAQFSNSSQFHRKQAVSQVLTGNCRGTLRSAPVRSRPPARSSTHPSVCLSVCLRQVNQLTSFPLFKRACLCLSDDFF